jgi:hypothetical protein
MDDEIVDHKSALSYLFRLYQFKSRRKAEATFNIGAGYGLKDTLSHIFACKGKFIFGTGNSLGAYMNPVHKAATPSKLMERYLEVEGTQYMIIIPLSDVALSEIPESTELFMELED